LNGYVRAKRTARLLDAGRAVDCLIYLTNHDPQCIYRTPMNLSLEDRARILINATPRRRADTDLAADSRGLFYLEGVRAGLAECHIRDEHLESLARVIRSHPGPWVDHVAPAAATKLTINHVRQSSAPR
jgi:hypothetical protein